MKALNLIPHTLTVSYRSNFYISFLRHLLLCVAVSLLSACATNFPDDEFYQSPGTVKHTAFTLGPGDKIRVTVYEHEDLSGSYSVDDRGRISLPLILGVNAKGHTLPELEKIIAAKFSRNYIVKPNVSIDVLKLRPFCILGEVRNPGCFSHIHGMSSTQAVALAGGYTYRAYKNKFAITREDGRKVVGNANTPIFGGDMIEVFERYF